MRSLILRVLTDAKYVHLLMLALISMAMAFAYFYLQLKLQLPPCPLCIVDRFALILISLTLIINLFLSAYYKKWWISLFCYLLNFVWLAIGGWASMRHVMLQYLPSAQGGTCIPHMDDTLIDLFTSAFTGTSDCGIVLWTFMDLSIPEYTLGLFVLLFILNCRLMYSLKSRK